jgi:hypothetical protein
MFTASLNGMRVDGRAGRGVLVGGSLPTHRAGINLHCRLRGLASPDIDTVRANVSTDTARAACVQWLWHSRRAHVANLNAFLPRVGATKPRAVRCGDGWLTPREPQVHRVEKLATPLCRPGSAWSSNRAIQPRRVATIRNANRTLQPSNTSTLALNGLAMSGSRELSEIARDARNGHVHITCRSNVGQPLDGEIRSLTSHKSWKT